MSKNKKLRVSRRAPKFSSWDAGWYEWGGGMCGAFANSPRRTPVATSVLAYVASSVCDAAMDQVIGETKRLVQEKSK